MKQVGTGTQKVEQELFSLFPGTQVSRMDADTVNAVNTHEVILNRFRQENIPVLVGTQMVAKGLDMPNVTLVGVLDGDLSLYSDSYRAAETTFNMLTQVVGRAGRGQREGKAIIQTMAPGHKVITLASRQDYDGFYETEISLRKLQNLPPFGDLIHLTFTGQDEAGVLRGGARFAAALQKCLQASPFDTQTWDLLGPAPCPVPKINYHFRYRLTLRGKADKPLRELLAHLMRQFSKDKENRGVTLFADINGFE
jgi:primosomal protein N' (replication factor Y)